MQSRSFLYVAPIALVVCSLSCGGSAPSRLSPSSAPAATAPTPDAHDDGLASLITSVPEGTLGPYVGYGPKGALALFSPPHESQRRWWVQALDEQGKPKAEPFGLGPSPDDVPFATVRPIGEDVFGAIWVRRIHHTDVLEGALVKNNSMLSDNITTFTQARGKVIWADAVATSKATILLWVEQQGEETQLQRLLLNPKGEPIGQSEVLQRNVRAWDTVAIDDGMAVALVIGLEEKKNLGSVALLTLDAAGHPKGAVTPISHDGSARFDIGLVRAGQRLLLAWTEVRQADSVIRAAVANFEGRLLVEPRTPRQSLGGQALVALVAPAASKPNQALLVFEEFPSSNQPQRELRMTTLSDEAIASSEGVRLAFSPVGQPNGEYATSSDGFVFLTRAQACAKNGACDDIPWYVRLSSSLTIDAAAPVVVSALHYEPPVLMWSPGCTSMTCLALAAGGQDPTPIVMAKLPKGALQPNTFLVREPAPKPPFVERSQTLLTSIEPLSAFDAATAGSTTYVGWVTHFVEGQGIPQQAPRQAPGNPNKPTAAHLLVQRIDPSGMPLEGPTTVSVRAMSRGGIALAPHPTAQEVCVAWTARDAGTPQVFLTRIGADGKTKLQRMITHGKGDVSDVAIAAHGDGWIVAWVDWRDGQGNVYAARVGASLIKLGPEKLISRAAGDASDLSLAVMGDLVFMAYGSSRADIPNGISNPTIRKLNAKTLEPIGEEQIIDSSALPVHLSKLSVSGHDLVLAWMAQGSPDCEAASCAFARASRIDPDTLRVLTTADFRKSGTTPASLSLRCDEQRCQGVLLAPHAGKLDLFGLTWVPTSTAMQRNELGSITSPSVGALPPAMVGDALFLADQGLEGQDRLRRIQVRWTP
ncbi:MAG TPA: hypothetical protein PKL73_01985 [Polyangiaceae bacterium]|jgi:hypothetical protein|nr:MAG: hypothetical protein BWY17_01501 [Deltaproteobacteria bacterium ADurb.Bin207]HNS95691.1 hypothetical protein [Polyangiaceae bacterium]HNZ21158.1 hypothetical protein [Polyangiaceae bacterium]HOD23704.1 hypothetical protein [Polyangiaceae bacterium]HOE48096.1 hypothetical protein [Polyangiaceae bacterium]